MDLNGLRDLLANHRFVLRKPTLPAPQLASEFTLGGVHYQFFGKGQLYFPQAQEFAAAQTYDGQQGRLLTIQCGEQEVGFHFLYLYFRLFVFSFLLFFLSFLFWLP
jgi:hypothetical protein